MSEKFTRKWEEKEAKTPFYTKIKEAVRSPAPLKPRLNFAIKRIGLQIQRLEKATDRFSKRDKSLFARIVIDEGILTIMRILYQQEWMTRLKS